MASYSRGRNLVQVGILAIVATVVFSLLFLWLTDRGLSLTRSDLYVHLSSAEGLKKGDPVFFRGVPVGEVRSLNFAEDGGVLVRNRLKRRVPLRADATAELAATDIFGSQSIVLSGGSTAAPLLADGDTIVGEVPSSLAGQFESLGTHAEAVGTQVARLLGDTTIELVQGTLAGASGVAIGFNGLVGDAQATLAAQNANLTATTADLRVLLGDAHALLAAQSADLTATTANTAALTANLSRATQGEELSLAIANLERATANLDAMTTNMTHASASLASALDKLNNGHGTAGRLLNDPVLFERAFAATARLEALLEDVQANPRRYVSFSLF
jgi:phospholipid/cholesterol/gamma-HCH transport system substrate-binding protein